MDQEHLEAVEHRLTAALAAWSAGSVTVGASLALVGGRLRSRSLAGFGRQTAMWGAVDGLIAGAGVLTRRDRGALSQQEARAKARSLRRLLIANAAADVGYVVGGLAIAARGRHGRTTMRMGSGDGLAIAVQGAFLLAVDAKHAAALSPRR